jgi:ribA/ribD-fused uncharacterized protein
MSDILEFRGDYRWLSNMTPCIVTLDGVAYRSVEHAYMSAKSDDAEWKEFCFNTESPYTVKQKSKDIILVDNWQNIKINVMYSLLEQKFNQEPFRQKLIDTGDCYIQEGNRWKGTFWGIDLDTNKGTNHLGNLIMKIRDTL